MSSRQQEMGRRVRRRRMALGLQQRELAARAQMRQEYVSDIERGAFKAINPEGLVALSRALGTTTDYLLQLSEEPGPVTESAPALVEAPTVPRHQGSPLVPLAWLE